MRPEPTACFVNAIRVAARELKAEGKLTAEDAKVTAAFFRAGPTQQRSVHNSVRERYIRRELKREGRRAGVRLNRNLDWLALIRWIKENWVTIVRIILMVLPMVV
jgi:hypothetical protein